MGLILCLILFISLLKPILHQFPNWLYALIIKLQLLLIIIGGCTALYKVVGKKFYTYFIIHYAALLLIYWTLKWLFAHQSFIISYLVQWLFTPLSFVVAWIINYVYIESDNQPK